MILILGLVAVVVGGFAVLSVLGHGSDVVDPDPSHANVGECVSGTSAYEMEIRSCQDPKAVYKVAEKFRGASKASAPARCDGASGATTYFFKESTRGSAYGTLLCLAPNHR